VRLMPERTWVDVGVGDGHTCALDDTGRVWCWGDNERLQLGRGAGPARGTPRTVCP
jgi:alpha-tubulin suppressor-like RCC1 family protein